MKTPKTKNTGKKNAPKINSSKSTKLVVGSVTGATIAGILIVIFWSKIQCFFIILLTLCAIAVGMEGFEHKADIEKLWESGNYQEAQYEVKKGVKIYGKCVSQKINCTNFKTQGSAQIQYDACLQKIVRDNTFISGIGQVRDMDIYGLDGNRDGIVCNSLSQ